MLLFLRDSSKSTALMRPVNRSETGLQKRGLPMDISIYVAAHRKENIDLPEGYKICQVNSEKNGRWEGCCVHDNDGTDNISLKNESYCELTALYELWKNCDSDIKGIAHYRRFFSDHNELNLNNYLLTSIDSSRIKSSILKKNHIIEYLNSDEIIIEYPCNPEIANAYEDLLRYVYPQDIDILCKTVLEYYPDYRESIDSVLHSTRMSYLNMFIARKSVCDEYCSWLFDVLAKAEKIVDTAGYDVRHRRVFGYLGEFLLNVWIRKNRPSVRYVFSLLVKPSETGSLSAKSILKKSRYLRYIKNAYLSIFEKKYYAMCRLRKKELGEVVGSDPYSRTLDDIYRGFGSVADVNDFYSNYAGYVSEDWFQPDGSMNKYSTVFFEYDPNDNGVKRCIATAFIEDVSNVSIFLNDVKTKYSEKYTVNCRIVTKNSDVALSAGQHPEVYFYKVPDHSC